MTVQQSYVAKCLSANGNNAVAKKGKLFFDK